MIVPFWILLVLSAPGQVATGAFLPTLPLIAAEFDVPIRLVQFGVTAYVAGFALGQVPAGWATDRIGRRPTALVGAVVFLLAAALSALSPSLEVLIGLRALEGAGAGALLVAQRAMMRDMESGPALARSLAVVSGSVWVLGGLSAVIAGLLAGGAGWRPVVAATAAFGVLIAVAALRIRPAPAGAKPPGTPLGPSYVRTRVFWRHAGVGALLVGAFYAFLTGGPAILSGKLGVPGAVLGIVQLGAVGVFMATALAARRWGMSATPGFLLAILAGAGLLLLPLSLPGVLLSLALLAAGAGLALPPALAGAVTPFPDQAGAASGGANLLQTGGVAVASALASLPGDPAVVVPGAMLALASLAFLLDKVAGPARSRRE